MNIFVISFTDRGHSVSKRIEEELSEHSIRRYGKADGLLPYESLRMFAEYAMQSADAVIFIGAVGIAVRACAPFLRGKDVDPAVVVIDENARFVISVLSGHIGGANRLTSILAQRLGSIPVITTATDGRGVFAADTWAIAHGCVVKNKEEIKYLSGAVLRGETIGIQSDFPVVGSLPELVEQRTNTENGLLITIKQVSAKPFAHTLIVVPRILHLGIGCRRNTPPEKLIHWVMNKLSELELDRLAIADISSITLKQEETAILQLAESLHVPTQFYSAEELEAVEGIFPPSDFVRKTTGTDNVCQRSAAKASDGGVCLLEKTAQDGMTLSIYQEKWRAAF